MKTKEFRDNLRKFLLDNKETILNYKISKLVSKYILRPILNLRGGRQWNTAGRYIPPVRMRKMYNMV